ncbi:MAG: glycosyltransferase family 4 protein [Candidatus Omnitrophica bacterium]|nr:glycosyltransferase family 4 protein [Candidatus Omnitrophota bacterium]
MQKKDILWVNTVFPEPPTDGNKLRNYNLIVNLSEFYNIHLVTYSDRKDPIYLEGLLSRVCKTINTVELSEGPVSLYEKIANRLGTFLAFEPKFCRFSEEKKLKNKIDFIVDNHPIVCIICASPWVARLCLPKTKIPLILDEQNVEYILMKNLFSIEKPGLRKVSRYFDFLATRIFEEKLLNKFEAVTVASENDAFILNRLSKREYSLVPNGVDLEYWKYGYKRNNSKKLVFSGGMSYFPNVEAMSYFLEDIFPKILEKDPSVRLVIAGKNPSLELKKQVKIFGDTVCLTGFLEDMRPIMYEASVFVVPIRAGSGTRLKILEAMAAGIPVISTSKGAEGLRVTNGENIIIADTAHEFVKYVLELVNNDELRCLLAKNARKLVEELYGWSSVTNNMQKVINNCIDRNYTGRSDEYN